MSPKISIIVPCYNQAQYLDEALQSALDQTYENWECIIVNDGSPDNTKEVAKKWLEKDYRFRYIFQENGGVSNARNNGIAMAIGEFILPLDADDKIEKKYCELAINAFSLDKSLKLVYCNSEKFGLEFGKWNLPDFSLQKLANDNMIPCSAIYRKTYWQEIGGYDLKMTSGLEDYEFWINLLKNGGNVFKIDDVCFFYRIKSISRQQNILKNGKTNLLNYISIKHADFFIAQKGNFFALSNQIEDLHNTINSKVILSKIFIKKVLLFWLPLK